uniref:Ig-like domain-containing protein n=1 Tax=Eptatretus burgeri TaxID=7764 RepID=A0A8C4WPD6_EPTBU
MGHISLPALLLLLLLSVVLGEAPTSWLRGRRATDLVWRGAETSTFSTKSTRGWIRKRNSPVLTLATVGSSATLVCHLPGVHNHSPSWRRHNASLTWCIRQATFVVKGRRLYIPTVSLLHVGVYTCQMQHGGRSIQELHLLHVHRGAFVTVEPQSQVREPGAPARFHCQGHGLLGARLAWTKNGEAMNLSTSRRLAVESDGAVLRIERVQFEDTAMYSCVAQGAFGRVQAPSRLFVMDFITKPWWAPRNAFYIFSTDGIWTLEPTTCELHSFVHAEFSLSDPHAGLLCGPRSRCAWGALINVRNRILVASQPAQRRLILLHIYFDPHLQAIPTAFPVCHLLYEESLDQLFLLGHGSSMQVCCVYSTLTVKATTPVSFNSIQITLSTKNNKKKVIPRFILNPTTKPLTVLTPCTARPRLFIPSIHLQSPTPRFGLIWCTGQAWICILDLVKNQLEHTIDLSPWNCKPRSLTFTQRGGTLIVQCLSSVNHSLQLCLDILTGTVLGPNSNAAGSPHTSPDGQFIVSLSHVHDVTTMGQVEPTKEKDERFKNDMSLGTTDQEPRMCKPRRSSDAENYNEDLIIRRRFLPVTPVIRKVQKGSCIALEIASFLHPINYQNPARGHQSKLQVQAVSPEGYIEHWLCFDSNVPMAAIHFVPTAWATDGFDLYVAFIGHVDLLVIELQMGNWSLMPVAPQSDWHAAQSNTRRRHNVKAESNERRQSSPKYSNPLVPDTSRDHGEAGKDTRARTAGQKQTKELWSGLLACARKPSPSWVWQSQGNRGQMNLVLLHVGDSAQVLDILQHRVICDVRSLSHADAVLWIGEA